MSKLSMRQVAKELGISPAYLSYMVNGKRHWRKDLYQRYMSVVNTFVNGDGLTQRKTTPIMMPLQREITLNTAGGSERESNHLPRSSRGITDLKSAISDPAAQIFVHRMCTSVAS